MEESRGRDWRRRGDPPLQHSHQQKHYPVATATVSHQQQQQHASQGSYKDDYDTGYNSNSQEFVNIILGAEKDPQPPLFRCNLTNIPSSSSSSASESSPYQNQTSIEVQQTPQLQNIKNKYVYSQSVSVPIQCLLLKIGDYKLGFVTLKKQTSSGQIKVTFSNGFFNGNGSDGGFIQVQTNTPDFFDNIGHKKVGKSCDFRIPLSSVVSFKLYTEHEPKFLGRLISGFIQVSAEEGERIRQMFNLTNEQFDPNCGEDMIRGKYIKFSTPRNRLIIPDVVKIKQIFGHRMELIDRDTSQFYLNGTKNKDINDKNHVKDKDQPNDKDRTKDKNELMKRREKRLENIKNEMSFKCSSIHFGKYSYEGENTVFLNDILNAMYISMKHSSGKKMTLVRIPNRQNVIYKLAQYPEDGQNKLMLFGNIRENKYAFTFGEAIGVDLKNDFRPGSQADMARMYVVLFINTNDQNELDTIQDSILKIFAGKCQKVSGIKIIDEILKVTKYTLRP